MLPRQREENMEKSIKQALKFFKKDFEEEGVLKDGLYDSNRYNMLCNFARKVLEFEKSYGLNQKYKLTNDKEAFATKVDALICNLEDKKDSSITEIKTFIFDCYREMKGVIK